SQGYSCCEKDNCDIYYNDDAGDWGVSMSNEWCGIRDDCSNPNNFAVAQTCSEDYTNMGYPCCNECNVVLVDETGRWGVENNDWCGISDSC
ncbi:Non-catalytic module family DOC2, partial [Piromyces sp. E2]